MRWNCIRFIFSKFGLKSIQLKTTIQHNNQTFEIDLSKPLDISIPLTNNEQNPIAWYQSTPIIEPVKDGDWIGKVSEGKSSTNFNNIFFNPHAHGTHTECLGHITKDFYSNRSKFIYRNKSRFRKSNNLSF